MCPTTCLNIDSFDVYYSDGVTWHNTSLIQIETIFCFSFFFTFKVFWNWVGFQYDLISLILDLKLFLFGQRWVMCDIQMSVILSLFSTMLPNMRTKYSSSSCVDDMSPSMECSQCIPSFYVNTPMNFSSNHSILKGLIQIMQETMTNFLNILNLILLLPNFKWTKIMNLTTWSGIKCTSIKNHNILAFFFLLDINQNSYYLSIELL